MRIVVALCGAMAVLAVPGEAAAYIGPGAGLGVIGTVLGVLAATLLALVGFAWYPLKRLLQRMKTPATSGSEVKTS